MKKLTLALALCLCLILCAFAFASCGKDGKKTATTVADTTVPGETECAHTWETRVERPATCSREGQQSDFCTKCGAKKPDSTTPIATIAHTPGDVYKIDAYPTCTDEGYKSYHCTVCDAICAETIVPIDVDQNAHTVEEWNVTTEPTLTTDGQRTGTCTSCHQPVNQTFSLTVYKSSDFEGEYASGSSIVISKTVGDISGEGKTFHPSDADNDGNDLWIEYSFLWNDTLPNWDKSKSEMSLAGFKNEAGSYRHFYYVYTNDGQSGDCPYTGHFDYSTYLGGLGWQCAVDPGNGQPRYKAGWDSPLTRASSPYIYDEESQTTGGWHRIGVRIHQEAAVDNDKGGVVYSGYSELYVDGVKVWKVLLDMQGNWDSAKSEWKQQNGYGGKGKADLKHNDLLLWYAKTELEEGDVPEEWTLHNGLYYKDHDDLIVYSSMAEFANSTETAYAQFYDVNWTCGDGFVRNVTQVATPAERTITLDDMGTPETEDDVVVSGAIFYQ